MVCPTVCNTRTVSNLEGVALLLRGGSWMQCAPTVFLLSVQATLTFTDSKGDVEQGEDEDAISFSSCPCTNV